MQEDLGVWSGELVRNMELGMVRSLYFVHYSVILSKGISYHDRYDDGG